MARKSAATKKKAPAKKTSSPKEIKVEIDLGSLEAAATPEQIARLKALVDNQVKTWVKADLKKPAPPVHTFEFPKPIPTGGDDK